MLQARPSIRLQSGSSPRRIVIAAATDKKNKGKVVQKDTLDYGNDWYAKTRELSKPKRTVREEIEYRRAANSAANNGRERKDLYTNNWDGSEYKGNPLNVGTVLALIAVLTPIAGLAFAYFTYGDLWG